MLYNSSGILTLNSRPLRASSAEEDKFRAMLKKLDSLLDLRWFPNAAFNHKTGNYEGKYAVISKWGSADPRWPLYRKGEISEPFDILGFVAADLQNADSKSLTLEDAEASILKMLESADNARTPWKQRMARTMERNRKIREDARKNLLDEVHAEAEYQFNKVKGNPIVAVSTNLGE